jgi:hypothetical protein
MSLNYLHLKELIKGNVIRLHINFILILNILINIGFVDILKINLQGF